MSSEKSSRRWGNCWGYERCYRYCLHMIEISCVILRKAYLVTEVKEALYAFNSYFPDDSLVVS